MISPRRTDPLNTGAGGNDASKAVGAERDEVDARVHRVVDAVVADGDRVVRVVARGGQRTQQLAAADVRRRDGERVVDDAQAGRPDL